MRKLLYDCYFGKDAQVLVKTVATQKEAKEWEATHPENFYKIRLETVTTLQNPQGSTRPARHRKIFKNFFQKRVDK